MNKANVLFWAMTPRRVILQVAVNVSDVCIALYREDGNNTVLRKGCNHAQDYKVSQTRRLHGVTTENSTRCGKPEDYAVTTMKTTRCHKPEY